MTTKAIIISKISDSNKYLVRIPYFEQANVSNNTLTNSYMEATLAYTPGIINSYKENDVVYVSFEDHTASKPIIIGKLSLSNDKERGYANVNTLSVSSDATLPSKTSIGNIDDVGTFLEVLDEKVSHLDDITHIEIIDLR